MLQMILGMVINALLLAVVVMLLSKAFKAPISFSKALIYGVVYAIVVQLAIWLLAMIITNGMIVSILGIILGGVAMYLQGMFTKDSAMSIKLIVCSIVAMYVLSFLVAFIMGMIFVAAV